MVEPLHGAGDGVAIAFGGTFLDQDGIDVFAEIVGVPPFGCRVRRVRLEDADKVILDDGVRAEKDPLHISKPFEEMEEIRGIGPLGSGLAIPS